MMQRFLIISLVFLSFAFTQVYAAPEITTSAKQAIVIDYDTGQVLYEKNADERMPTSSMSKVISMMLVFDALKRGEISLNDTYNVSEEAWQKGGSKMFVEVKKDVKIEDLIRGVIVQSGNDAAMVLAEGLAGSEGAFADRLNTYAKSIGMDNSNFVNSNGWPDDEHYSTARDLATMASVLIRDFPNYYTYYSEKEFTYNSIKQQNRNPLLYRNIGADGIKTGHTVIGGYGLIGSGTRDGRRVIMVLNGMESERDRAQESARILDWALSKFKKVVLFGDNRTVVSAPVVLGKKDHVDLVLNKDLFYVVPKGREDNLNITVEYPKPLVAPIAAGQEAGKIKVMLAEQVLYEGPVYAREAVAGKGFFSRTAEKAKIMVTGQTPSS